MGDVGPRELAVERHGLDLGLLGRRVAAEHHLRAQALRLLLGLGERDVLVPADLVLALLAGGVQVAQVVGPAAGTADLQDEAGHAGVPPVGLVFARLALGGGGEGVVQVHFGHG